MSYSWIGLVIGIIGLVYGFYRDFAPRNKRYLVYSVNPTRTRITVANKTTDLEVVYKGEKLGNVDIVAAQIAIWNMGKESVSENDILTKPGEPKEVVIEIKSDRILEASMINLERQETGFKIANVIDYPGNGQIHISWDILEKNDGASFQVIYVGSPKTNIWSNAVIRGQRNIKRVTIASDAGSPAEENKQKRNHLVISIILLVVAFVTGILNFGFKLWDNNLTGIFFLDVFFLFIMGMVLFQDFRKIYPPFKF
jgi:hypothetical protein